jgi:hypothetical protein
LHTETHLNFPLPKTIFMSKRKMFPATCRKWVTIVLLLSSSLTAFSQRRSGYAELDAGIYFIKQVDPAIGAHFSGNIELTNAVFLGAELGVVKFDHIKKAYLPLLARFSIMPSSGGKRINPLVVLAPGYGVYEEKFRVGNTWYESKGGFSFYGGAGVAFPGKGRGSLVMTIGYSTFGFTTNGHKSNIDGVGLRIGAMIR